MPTTEVATLVLIPGSDIGDPQSPAAGVVKFCGDTIAEQDGFQWDILDKICVGDIG